MANRDVVLALDNSLDLLTLALAAEGRFLEERRLKPRLHTSEVVGLEASNILAGHDLTVQDLTHLVVTVGPGSFTGIRVALAFCKGLREGLSLPLIGLSTLDVLAQPLSFLDGYFLCPLVDAKKGEVFAALYRTAAGGLVKVLPERSMKPQEVSATVQPPCVCFGTGVALCRESLNGLPGISCIEEVYDRVSGEVLLSEGMRRLNAGRTEDAKPMYGRRSEAEIKFRIEAL